MNVDKMRRNAHRGRVETADWRDLPPETKVQIVEAMGFIPMSDDHDRECPAALDPRGFVCQCAGEPTAWVGPTDVQEHRGETWAQRVAKRRKAVAR